MVSVACALIVFRFLPSEIGMSRQAICGSRREVTQPDQTTAIVLKMVGRLTATSAASAVRLRSPHASNAST